MSYKISVIVPVYNVEKYISRCIDSVLSQSYNDWELILVDDGSTDNSGVICDKYAQNNKKIIAIHQRNQGVSVARNAGIKASNGEYLLFADADDWLENTMLEEMLSGEHDADLIACEYYEVNHFPNDTEKVRAVHIWNNQTKPFKSDDIPFDVMSKTGVLWNKLIKRNVIGGVLFKQGLRYGEDMLFLAEILKNIQSAILIPVPYYYYFVNRQGNVVSSIVDERSIEFLESALLVYFELDSFGDSSCGIARICTTINIVFSKIPYAEQRAYHKYFKKCKEVIRTPPIKSCMRYLFDKRFSTKGKISFVIARVSPELYYVIRFFCKRQSQYP